MKSMSGQVIWITGASSGIGEALAYELSTMGNTLILSARNKERLKEVKAQCNNPAKVFIIPMDLGNFNLMPSLVSHAIAATGHIDILINNAGISQRSLIADTHFDVYKKLIDINYLGTIALSKAVLPHFIAQQKGHFVTITSLMGRFGSPFRSGYCGAKHGLHGFFDVLRMEHEKDKLQVTLVCPGFIKTNVAVNALTADGSPQNVNDHATSRGMEVHTFAKKLINAVAKKKFEVYIGGKEIAGVYLKRFFPKWLHHVVQRSKVV
ncbi:SDR family oxidoreductase [uncultured Muriicola sp.]|uniref:SDR family oxidoreductase n=1 Tax=uncultured Muriicola sp. TaxID=1583102 RepID=UPI0026312E19|nr:SDR family oxidoreductase [uncultured Muriicola sp.]